MHKPNYIAEKLHEQANRDLAKRSLPSTVIYLVLFAIFASLFNYSDIHPLIWLVVGSLLLIGTIVRAYYALKFDVLYKRNAKIWQVVYFVSTLVLATTWGLFCMFAINRYGLEWTAILVLLSATGFSAGAVTTLCINLSLIITYLVVMMLPTVIAIAVLQAEGSLAFVLIITTYFVFLVGVSKRLNLEYWTALKNTMLLDQRALELEAVNKELESFAYSVSHDLRTPLRAIDGFSHALLEDAAAKLDSTERNYLDRIRKASQRMGKLIDDMLQLSLIARRKIESQELDFTELAQASINKLALSDPQRSVDVSIQRDVIIKGDKVLLEILIDNLVGNAWKYSSLNSTARIEVGVDEHQVYYVKDNGVGFNMKYADKLFGAFQRLHNTDEFAGTGIGLATAHRIISRHGGRIWAQAQEQSGACFYFTME